MAFTCLQCGECCSSMGEIIEILEEQEDYSFRIRFTVTGEERIVSIDGEKRELFRQQDISAILPMACPFLRQTARKKYVCSVHGSRPDLCRQYSCFRILVTDSEERKIGRVTDGSRYFLTSDERLHALWNSTIANVVIPDEKKWEDHVEQTLVSAGYRVLR